MKEKILNTFKSLGFELEEIEEIGHTFKYEGINYMWMSNNGDENFLSIGVPAILDKPDGELVSFYQLIDKLNGTLKYIKANVIGDSLWLFYERELFGNEEDIEDLISRMIVQLEMAFRFFTQQSQEALENDGEEGEDDGSHVIISDIGVVDEEQSK